jgi:uncharacterized protein YbaA (DUF1428 family)
MRGYVDGYVLAVPKKKIRAYRRLAQKARESGGSMVHLIMSRLLATTSAQKWAGIKFPRTVKACPARQSCFSYIVFKNRKHRDAVNAKVMKDPFMNPQEKGRADAL